MSGSLLLILVLPLLIPVGIKLYVGREFNWFELCSHLVLVVLSCSLGYYFSVWTLTHDVQIENGTVVKKERVSVPCRHSYSCGTEKHPRTCYEHIFDYDWDVFADTGHKSLEVAVIDPIDRQGVKEPPRFTQVQMGDAFSVQSSYENYIKAAPDSLMQAIASAQLQKQYATKLEGLDYPNKVYDYYRVDRVLVSGKGLSDFSLAQHLMSDDLSDTLKKLGAKYKANAVVVFTDDPSENFARALMAKWLKGKQNDTVVVIGLDPALNQGKHAINWVYVSGWAQKDLYEIELRDDIKELGALAPSDMKVIDGLLATRIAEGFKFRPINKDFAYLKDEIQPAPWVVATLLGINVVISLLLAYYFTVRDFAEDLANAAESVVELICMFIPGY